jgi:hypothetical protein
MSTTEKRHFSTRYDLLLLQRVKQEELHNTLEHFQFQSNPRKDNSSLRSLIPLAMLHFLP